MKKKLIGIPGWSVGETTFGVGKAYLEYIKQYGEIIILTPRAYVPDLDLLVLPGGKDVINGNEDDYSFKNSAGEHFLEIFDYYTLPKYIESNTPIYGICRGMQAIMKHFKIPLIQDIWWDHGYSKDENDTKVNTLNYLKYKHIQDAKNGTKTVGSWHHQGVSMASMINPNQVDFDVIAYCGNYVDNRYNIVEFAEHKELPIVVEQSHPERNGAMLERFLFEKLLKVRENK